MFNKMLQRSQAVLFVSVLSISFAQSSEQKKRSEQTCQNKKQIIALDIGHSIKRPGAISARGKPEFAFNKRFVEEFIAHNKDNKTLEFFMINQSGKNIRLSTRTKIAAQKKADLFISIHHDSLNPKYIKQWTYNGTKQTYSNKFKGHSFFISEKNIKFKQSFNLAKEIATTFQEDGLTPTLHHAEPIKGENRKLLDKNLGIYEAPFAVLKTAKMPAVLIELGVIKNKDEEKLLETPAYRKRLIVNITKALNGFCS